MPKVVIAVVPGWAVGGGHSLHVVCDMTLASKILYLSKLMLM
jgi:naphthoate synthase